METKTHNMNFKNDKFDVKLQAFKNHKLEIIKL